LPEGVFDHLLGRLRVAGKAQGQAIDAPGHGVVELRQSLLVALDHLPDPGLQMGFGGAIDGVDGMPVRRLLTGFVADVRPLGIGRPGFELVIAVIVYR
jgi:hypothetical protein